MARHEPSTGGCQNGQTGATALKPRGSRMQTARPGPGGGGTERGRNYGPRQRAATCLATMAWAGTRPLHQHDGVTLDGV